MKTLLVREPMLVLRAAPVATLRRQNDNTASSVPEDVIVTSPIRRTGVLVREEFESTAVPVFFIR
jgi:hypothetical protein